MLTGVHLLLYSADPAADQAFLRDVLGLSGVAAGEDRMIFALPPAEIAMHPHHTGSSPGAATAPFVHEHAGNDLLGAVLYLICDDLRGYVDVLASKQVRCSEIVDAEFGMKTTVILPSGGELGLYQPNHPTAIGR